MVELADTPDLGSGAVRRGGSTPPLGILSNTPIKALEACSFVVRLYMMGDSVSAVSLFNLLPGLLEWLENFLK